MTAGEGVGQVIVTASVGGTVVAGTTLVCVVGSAVVVSLTGGGGELEHKKVLDVV